MGFVVSACSHERSEQSTKAKSKAHVQYCTGFVKHRPRKTYGGVKVHLYIFLPSAGASRLSRFPFGETSTGTIRTIGADGRRTKVFFSSVISNRTIRYSMSWCAGCLSWWGPLQRGDLCRGFSRLLIDVWLFVSEVSTLNLILLTTQTMVTTGILPPQGKSLW